MVLTLKSGKFYVQFYVWVFSFSFKTHICACLYLYVIMLLKITDFECEKCHGGGITLVWRDFARTRSLQTYQQLCQKHSSGEELHKFTSKWLLILYLESFSPLPVKFKKKKENEN